MKHTNSSLRFKIRVCIFTIFAFPPQTAHLAGVVRTDGYAKLSLDEGVVYQVSHICKCLPIVFTDTETKLAVSPSDYSWNT